MQPYSLTYLFAGKIIHYHQLISYCFTVTLVYRTTLKSRLLQTTTDSSQVSEHVSGHLNMFMLCSDDVLDGEADDVHDVSLDTSDNK